MENNIIQEQFNKVIAYSQDQPLREIHTDLLFNQWQEAKSRFIQMMGGMIYELDMPVTFELDTSAKEQKLNEFLDWVCREYGEDMWSFFKENYDGILENKLKEPWGDFPRGMKLSKVLMKVFGLDAEDVRQKLSMLIQSNKVTGKLCMSVHPLDFLSASETNHGWRSCHALDGEYRSGNISYMVDKCTVMMYLKSDAPDVKLPRFPADVPWNDKKWRCYFYLDSVNRTIYAARQYPFHSDAALDLANKLFRSFHYFDPDFWDEWANRIQRGYFYGVPFHGDETVNEFIPPTKFIHMGIRGMTKINGEEFMFDDTKVIAHGRNGLMVVPMKKFIDTDHDAFCFNDVTSSHTYAPYIMRYDPERGPYMPDPRAGMPKLIVGKGFNCLCCERTLPSDSDVMFCRDCLDGEYHDPREWEEVEEDNENEYEEYVTPNNSLWHF